MSDTEAKPLMSVLSILLGILVLAGAITEIKNQEWPIFMPPQLDVFGTLFGLFGNPIAIYLSAILLIVVGGFLVFLGALSLIHRPRT